MWNQNTLLGNMIKIQKAKASLLCQVSLYFWIVVKIYKSTRSMDNHRSHIPNRFILRDQIYCFVALIVSWYCSKVAKSTYSCIIVIMLFQTWFIEWQRKNMNQRNTQLFLSCAFLFFLCSMLYSLQKWEHPFECTQQRKLETDRMRGPL